MSRIPLTLNIEEELTKKIKRIAINKSTDVSSMFEDYIRGLKE